MGCEKSSGMRSGSAPITFIKEAYFSPWAGPIKLRDGSLRSSASPSTMTTSIPCFVPSKASVIWGLRCTLRIFRSPGLLKTRKVSPSHRNQTGTVCGRPSARTVVNQMVGSSRKRCSTCASMGCVDAELLSSVLLLPADMVIEAVYPSKTLLTVQVVCRLQSAACPLCQQSSERIHGSYGRTVADVSCGGRRVTLALTVRKFVCRTPDCPRKIFTERLPDLVQPYARMTNRLSEVLQTLGFATCGELGARLAPKLGKGAPQAQQIADRFHLLKNLRERLKEVMDRRQSCLPEVAEQASDAIPAKAQGIKDKSLLQSAEPQGEPEPEKHYRTIPPSPYQRPPGMSYDAFQKQIRRDKRVARYEDVRTLFDQGLSQRASARKLKLSRATVGKFIQAKVYPERHPSTAGARRSLLDPYKGYLLQRWQQGCRNSVQLYDEITARGFQGSAPLL